MNADETIEQLKLALAEKERQLNLFSSLTSDFSYAVSISEEGKRKLDWAFGAYEEISGYSLSEDVTHEVMLQFIHPEETEKVEKRKKLLAAGHTVESEFRIITKSGEIKWLHEVAKPAWDPVEKRLIRILGSIRDISKSKNAEAELIKSEEKFRNIAENIPGLVFKYKFNPDGNDELLYLSKSVEAIFEIPHQEALNNINLMWDRIHKDDREEYIKYVRKSIEELSVWDKEYRIVLPSGKVKWLWGKGTPAKQEDDSVIWDALAIDITDRKEAEKALKESEEKLREAQRIGKTGHFEWNIKTNQVFWSDNLFKLYGLEYQEPDFELIKKIIHPDDYEYWETSVKKAIVDKIPLIIDLRMIKSNGEIIWIHNDTKLVLDDQGNSSILVGTAHDITERKNAEEALKKSENQLRELNATKDKLISIIGHDLRNPFVQMVELSKLIEDSLQNNDLEEVSMYSSMVQKLSERGHTLLMNLLDWSRNQTGRLELNVEIFDISQTIQETCDLLSLSARRKKIDLKYKPVKCMVSADQNMVTTVLRNLIGNAIKFSHKESCVEILNVSEGSKSLVKVIDQGIGMKPEQKTKLFNLSKNFTNVGTDNEKGSGLGLILCKEFVEKNKGTLTIESEYGKGSTFSFTLPRSLN